MPSKFLQKVAEDTNEYVRANKWHKGDTQRHNLFPLPEKIQGFTNSIDVVNEDYIKVAYEYVTQYDKVAILNMCSDRLPGGGYLKGTTAAEEELCRRSSLYPQLKLLTFPLKRNDVYYSRDVNIFKEAVTYTYLDDVRRVDVISVAAVRNPRLTHDKLAYADQDTELLMRRKIYSILKVAELQNVDCLVLSAFGCGAFRNPPQYVARLFRECLAHFHFKKVTFAIIDNTLIGRTTSNYKLFKTVLYKDPQSAD